MTMTALPFRANKRFVLDGRQVVPGEVVDVSMLDAQRVRNMERGNYGMRVATDVPDHEPVKSKRKSQSARRSKPRQPIVEPTVDVEGVDLEQEVSL